MKPFQLKLETLFHTQMNEAPCVECGNFTEDYGYPIVFCSGCKYCPGCGINPHFFEKLAGMPTEDKHGIEWCADCAWKLKAK